MFDLLDCFRLETKKNENKDKTVLVKHFFSVEFSVDLALNSGYVADFKWPGFLFLRCGNQRPPCSYTVPNSLKLDTDWKVHYLFRLSNFVSAAC